MKATFLEPLPGWAFSIPKSLCCLLRLPGAGLSLYEIATLDVGLVSAGWCRTRPRFPSAIAILALV